jgi:hypothetical protein
MLLIVSADLFSRDVPRRAGEVKGRRRKTHIGIKRHLLSVKHLPTKQPNSIRHRARSEGSVGAARRRSFNEVLYGAAGRKNGQKREKNKVRGSGTDQ